MKLLICALFALFGVGISQMVPQCTCDKITPCKESYVNSILPCADACQQNVAALGADYQKLRTCFLNVEPQIKKAVQCTENSLPNTCANETGHMVPKRYDETLKIATMNELNHILQRSGVNNQVQNLLRQGKKFYSCMRSCMDRKAGNCVKKLGCGLQLPSDNVMVQNTKNCAIKNGFNTAGVQKLCTCAQNSGIKQLEGICSKLNIS